MKSHGEKRCPNLGLHLARGPHQPKSNSKAKRRDEVAFPKGLDPGGRPLAWASFQSVVNFDVTPAGGGSKALSFSDPERKNWEGWERWREKKK